MEDINNVNVNEDLVPAFENHVDDEDFDIDDESDGDDEIMDDDERIMMIGGIDGQEDDFNGMDDVDDDDDDDDDELIADFLYIDGIDVPWNDVSNIIVDPSVKMLKQHAFQLCRMMTSVQLPEGLECIGTSAFLGCISLHRINIPSSVKLIGECAFGDCRSMQGVQLCEGLEEIGIGAFYACRSLQSIFIPPRIKSIEKKTFLMCEDLRNVHLPEGLEYIGGGAFARCNSLLRIKIPSTVKEISPYAFSTLRPITGFMYLNLEKVEFCDEIEKFVSEESIRSWWNNGLSEKSLKTYNLLIRYNVPARLGMLTIRQWQANIHDMLMRIPSFVLDDLDEYFNSIDSKLTYYAKSLPDSIPLLELAVWKSTLLEQHGWSTKLQCRDNCGASVIIPNVLIFL